MTAPLVSSLSRGHHEWRFRWSVRTEHVEVRTNCQQRIICGMTPLKNICRLLFGVGIVFPLLFIARAAESSSFPANQWVVLKPGTPSPGGRGWHQVSYDSEFKEVILFGGSASTYMSDTWTYSLETNTWTMRRPHPDLEGPCRRDNHNLVYDPVGRQHWLLNGVAYDNLQPNCSGFAAARRVGIWSYSRATNKWTRHDSISGTPRRVAPGMAYNPDNHTFLQFGGGEIKKSNATFVFDIAKRAWRQIKTSPSPPPRINIEGGLVYDKTNKVFVLFGGRGNSGFLNDTWLFDPATESWREMTPKVSPPARDVHAMAYDDVNQVTVLFSGRRGGERSATARESAEGKRSLNDTWIYEARKNTWTELTNVGNPPGRVHASAVYDPFQRVILVVTGRDTLVFNYKPTNGR